MNEPSDMLSDGLWDLWADEVDVDVEPTPAPWLIEPDGAERWGVVVSGARAGRGARWSYAYVDGTITKGGETMLHRE